MINKINPISRITDQKGFTIVELIIATSVFSVMLLLTTTGMIQIGRVYYKGIITGKTQQITRTISEDIVRAVQFGGTSNVAYNPGWPSPMEINSNGINAHAVCMNNVRYSYAINTRVSPENNPPQTARHALWVDIIRPGAECRPVDLTLETPGTSPGDNVSTDSSTDAANQRRELLSTNMRLSQFVVSGAADIVNVNIKVMYGEDDVIVGDPSTADASCISSRLGGQFCAFSALNTIAKRRL